MAYINPLPDFGDQSDDEDELELDFLGNTDDDNIETEDEDDVTNYFE